MTLDWDELQSSEFFQWFHISEVGRGPDATSGVSIRCKPGSFQEAIDLTFDLDEQQVVRQAILSMDRVWMGEEQATPYATDLLKSFLFQLAGDDLVISDFAQQLERLIAQLPGVISRTDTVSQPSFAGPALYALSVYQGERVAFELDGEKSVVVLTNLPGAQTLQVTWTAGPPVRSVAPDIEPPSSPYQEPPGPAPAPPPGAGAPGY